MEYSKPLSPWAGFWRKNEALLSEITFVGVVAIWGLTFVFSKNALDVVGPFAYNTIRMFLGGLTLALLTGRDWGKLNRAYLWPSLITGLVLFFSYGCQAYGQQSTTASKAAFLTGTNIVYVPILSALLLRRAPRLTSIAGVVFAFIGLILISLEPGRFSFAPGDGWVALSGIGWALYFIVLARYSPHLDLMLYSALHVFAAGVLSGLAWLWLEPLSVPLSSAALWIGVWSTGFVIMGLGTGVQTWVTRLASPTRVALIAALEPVFGAVAGWWIGELLTLRILTGGGLILAGMLLAELGHLLRGRNPMG